MGTINNNKNQTLFTHLRYVAAIYVCCLIIQGVSGWPDNTDYENELSNSLVSPATRVLGNAMYLLIHLR